MSGSSGTGLLVVASLDNRTTLGDAVRWLLATSLDYDYNDHYDHGKEVRAHMSVHTWSVAQAKAKFSEVIEKAKSEGPQTITRNGRKAAVLVAAEEWERKTRRKGTLVEFFARSPLRGSGINLERLSVRLRKPEL